MEEKTIGFIESTGFVRGVDVCNPHPSAMLLNDFEG